MAFNVYIESHRILIIPKTKIKNMKSFFTLLFVVLAALGLQAQEAGVFSQFYAHPILLNPGATGFDEHQVLLNFQNNWSGFPGAPRDYAVTYHGPLSERTGVGIQFFSEKIASIKVNQVKLNYAYLFEVNEFKIGAGISGEIQSQKVDPGANFDAADEILKDAINGLNTFDVTLGVYARNNNGLFLGLFVPKMIRTRLDSKVAAGRDALDAFQNFAFNIGYKYKMEDQGITLEPSIMMRKYRGVPNLLDVNFLASFLDEQLFGGLSYRPGEVGRGSLLVGGRWKVGTLMYSYNQSFQELNDYSGGGHEISLKFNINSVFGVEEM